ncbi:MAG: hypothetical protein OEW56_04555 [Gemmatimonadota bacterium]|nr:hypothetical protein [Gemmatimonadota bacterium]
MKFPRVSPGWPVAVGLLVWLCTACDSVTAPELTEPCVSWCNTLAPWPHDGNPFQSETFTIYSDGVGHEVLAELAEIAEDVLADLKAQFQITADVALVLPPGQQKLHVYAYKYRYSAEWAARAFWGGMMIFSLDHPRLAEFTERGHYRRLVTHELVHALQNVLVGSTHSYSTHTWFEEGLAEVVSALDAERSIWTEAALDQRIAEFGEWNPIAIDNDILPDIENAGVQYFNPMFELTMRYALDDAGLGRSLRDVRDVFLDMRDGTSFSSAFAAMFGLSVADFHDQYFARIRAYLP